MKVKNVLHLIETSGPGGAEKMLISLVENLDRSRYRSIICFLKDGWLNTQLYQCGFDTVIIPQCRGVDPSWVYKCIKLIQQRQIDLMHAHEFAMNTYGCMAAMITGVPIITTVHGQNYFWEKCRRRLAYRIVARHANRMVSVSESLKHFLIKRAGIRERDIVTIYNGIDLQQYRRSEDGMIIKRKLGINESGPVIGTIGNLYQVKGHTYLLKAAKLVVQDFPNATFLFIGRGELLGQLQTEAIDLEIARNVRFLGFREDIPDLLQTMDIFVLSSLSEGFSLVTIEAMAAERPVVATRSGGPEEIIEDGITGFLVPPKDPQLLASRISLLLKDKMLAQQFGTNGRRRIYEKFNLEQMVNAYQRLYEEAIWMRHRNG